jgi:hypothetical protein
MPVSYTNRKGGTYFLCQTPGKGGSPRYHFAREPQPDSPDAIPEGFEISESVNGRVSLVRSRPALITAEELAVVEKELARHPNAGDYRAEVKGKRIVVYDRDGPDLDGLLSVLEELTPFSKEVFRQRAEGVLEDMASFSPLLRFTLHDRELRTFSAESLRTFGDEQEWVDTGYQGALPELAREIIPLLDSDEFYDLY